MSRMDVFTQPPGALSDSSQLVILMSAEDNKGRDVVIYMLTALTLQTNRSRTWFLKSKQ